VPGLRAAAGTVKVVFARGGERSCCEQCAAQTSTPARRRTNSTSGARSSGATHRRRRRRPDRSGRGHATGESSRPSRSSRAGARTTRPDREAASEDRDAKASRCGYTRATSRRRCPAARWFELTCPGHDRRAPVPRQVREAFKGRAEGSPPERAGFVSSSSTSCTPCSAPANARARWTAAKMLKP